MKNCLSIVFREGIFKNVPQPVVEELRGVREINFVLGDHGEQWMECSLSDGTFTQTRVSSIDHIKFGR